MDYTKKTCTARSRCRQYTKCSACARIRQARFADLAEQAARLMKEPTLYVLVPHDTTPAGIEYARRYFTRIYRPVAGVWSVESGEFQAGFHLNVIADYSDTVEKFKGHIYKERIRTNVRVVAAYMTKAERAATREEGFHRQTGTIGTLANFLRQPNFEAPIVNGAQALHDLAPGHVPPSAPGPETPEETTRRWLAPVYAAAEHEATGAAPAAPAPADQAYPAADPPAQARPRRSSDRPAPPPQPWRTPHRSNPDVARAWCQHILSILQHDATAPPAEVGQVNTADPPACTN